MPSAWGHTRLLETDWRFITQESHCFSCGSVNKHNYKIVLILIKKPRICTRGCLNICILSYLKYKIFPNMGSILSSVGRNLPALFLCIEKTS